MTTLGICEKMQQKLLKRASIGQAYQFAKTGRAEPDFVTLLRLPRCGTVWRRRMPEETRDPLRQHTVLSEASSNGRRDFDFLKGPKSEAGIARHGYMRQAWS